MKWSLISQWAKEHGYEVDREKLEPKKYRYTWSKDTDGGEAFHVRDLATAVFNHMTDGAWIEYQKNYVPPQKEITYYV